VRGGDERSKLDTGEAGDHAGEVTSEAGVDGDGEPAIETGSCLACQLNPHPTIFAEKEVERGGSK
jgi:uncharacterized Zn-binding protein involved in type VI secretion